MTGSIRKQDECDYTAIQSKTTYTDKTPWKSVIICSILCICTASQFSVYFSSMWPYLQRVRIRFVFVWFLEISYDRLRPGLENENSQKFWDIMFLYFEKFILKCAPTHSSVLNLEAFSNYHDLHFHFS